MKTSPIPQSLASGDAMLASLRSTFDQVLAIIEKKNHDYAGLADPFSNFRAAELLGIGPEKAILVRALDKIARMGHLIDDEAFVAEESIEDTGRDLIGYIGLLLAYRAAMRVPAAHPERGAGAA